MCAIFWIYQIGKRSSIKHSKTRNTTKNLKNCMRPWIRSYQLFLDFCPRRAFLAAPGSPWQLQSSYFAWFLPPGGCKIVITRRSGQLQSSYFACADLWTCWIRFWYSRSPKLTKMIFFSFYFLYIFFIFSYFSILQPPTHWADLQLGRTSNSEDLQLGTNGNQGPSTPCARKRGGGYVVC